MPVSEARVVLSMRRCVPVPRGSRGARAAGASDKAATAARASYRVVWLLLNRPSTSLPCLPSSIGHRHQRDSRWVSVGSVLVRLILNRFVRENLLPSEPVVVGAPYQEGQPGEAAKSDDSLPDLHHVRRNHDEGDGEPEVGEERVDRGDEEGSEAADLPALAIRQREHAHGSDHVQVEGRGANDSPGPEVPRIEPGPDDLDDREQDLGC
mmetsp:Transcript_3158/g.7417  ORF Transcript_3158/g.7417 Transcript_3158/m.7417 type:complete len:209 (-) Transcript_3158:770-1396(-)